MFTPAVLPLHPFVLFPACLCVACSGPLVCVCVANAWSGAGRSQVTAAREPHLSSLASDNNGRGSSAVTFHLRRWMAAIVGFEERNAGREEGEDGFLYIIFHCERRFDAAGGISLTRLDFTLHFKTRMKCASLKYSPEKFKMLSAHDQKINQRLILSFLVVQLNRLSWKC